MPKNNDAALWSWAAIAQVCTERIGNIREGAAVLGPAGLDLRELDSRVTPMDVVQSQLTNVARPQSVTRRKQENRIVAPTQWRGAIDSTQSDLDLPGRVRLEGSQTDTVTVAAHISQGTGATLARRPGGRRRGGWNHMSVEVLLLHSRRTHERCWSATLPSSLTPAFSRY